ncbi:MAG: ADP-ribosylglycohydrolase family protein [Archaeoglobi archaeon]|nr:ADP-ribosylglycohydrolase family protein [Candidatus Mnemosynella bozhongmuii]
MRSKFTGCLLGVAIGDSLGMPVEGMSREKILEKYGEIRDFLPSPDGFEAGEWTDDTEMTLILCESLSSTIYFSPEDFSSRLRALESFRRYGPTTRRAVELLKSGVHWKNSGIHSNTDGAAMRAAPIGLLYNFSLDLVENYALISSSITHRGEGAIASAISVSVAVACILNGRDPVKEAIRRSEAYDEFFAEKLRLAYELRKEDVEVALKELGNSYLSYEAVPLAFYCHLSSESFEDAVLKAVNCGGDTDTIASITGALKGAEKGAEGIPERLKRVKEKERIIETAERLYDAFLRITS